MLADGLGLGSTTSDPWPRRFAVIVLTIGLVVAIVMKLMGGSIVPAIVFAQALTVVVAPLLGLILIVLTNSKELMGKHTNGVFLNTLAGLGLVMLFVLSGYVVSQKIVPKIQSWFFPPAATAKIEPDATSR